MAIKDSLIVSFTIKYRTLVVGVPIILIITIGLRYGLDVLYNQKPDLSDLISIFSALLVTLSLIYSGMALQSNQEMYSDGKKEEMEAMGKNLEIQQALANEQAEIQKDLLLAQQVNLFLTTLSDDVKTSREFWDENETAWQNSNGGDTIYNKLNGNRDIRKSIHSVMNYLESLAVMVREGSLSEEKVRDRFETIFKIYQLRTEGYLKAKNKRKSSESKEFRDFPKLAEKWRK